MEVDYESKISFESYVCFAFRDHAGQLSTGWADCFCSGNRRKCCCSETAEPTVSTPVQLLAETQEVNISDATFLQRVLAGLETF